ncbi:MAG TPA: hypothetical protein VFB33_10935 [Candidatus Binataceae bacterium]|nr:hypothetical protein [Candidatus Binataceae bacterium]
MRIEHPQPRSTSAGTRSCSATLSTGLGYSTDKEEVRCIVELLNAGFADQILLSAKVAIKICHKAYGGRYSHIYENIIPRLRSLSASTEQIESIMAGNPRRLRAVG